MQNKLFKLFLVQLLGKHLRLVFKANLAFFAFFILLLTIADVAKAQTPPTKPANGSAGAANGGGAKPDPNNELMNEGDEVDGNATGSAKSATQNKNAPKGAAAPASNTPSATSSGAINEEQKPEWTVLLMSFTDQGNAKAANEMRNAIATRYPNLSGVRVCTLEKGSAVVYGSFVGLEDPKAKPAIKMVKEIEENGARPFARAYLVRLQTTSSQTKLGPYDLSKARARFPNVVPLFTVKVATWSDFHSGEMSFADIQTKANAYCAELRLQGFDAYVKHDADDRSSTVTIGVFDSSAYDARTTLFHVDVERIMKKFPTLLVNGEPLLEPPPRGLTGAKPKAKPSILIEIPR